jgi:hypothetical protein
MCQVIFVHIPILQPSKTKQNIKYHKIILRDQKIYLPYVLCVRKQPFVVLKRTANYV